MEYPVAQMEGATPGALLLLLQPLKRLSLTHITRTT